VDSPEAVVLPLLEIPPEVKVLAVNIGTNYDPIKPSTDDEGVIAVDPLPWVIQTLGGRNRTFAVSMAVANYSGMATFYPFGPADVASSMSKLVADRTELRRGVPQFVPVISFSDLLAAIPRNVPLRFLKTDMQGWDLTAVTNAGREIRRFATITMETYTLEYKAYENCPVNHIDATMEYMTSMGYKPVFGHFESFKGEGDSTWERIGPYEGPSK